MVRFSVILFLGLGAIPLISALGQKQCITFNKPNPLLIKRQSAQQPLLSTPKHTNEDFIIFSTDHSISTPLLLDSKDDSAIHIAAATFADDIQRVSGTRPQIYNDTLPDNTGGRAIIIGSLGSRLISEVVRKEGGLADKLKGKWESFDVRVEESPVEGVEEALVITGSDRRGTVFGIYDLSEQLGVSPWYFWADVPTPPQTYAAFPRNEICDHGEPTVKYRGLFFNDELPVLWGWARQRWGYEPGVPPFQTGLYELTFELVLRLKGNYMWPAMWASMFDVDGLDISKGLPNPPTPGPNQVLAQRMGIVMGTSHHEPMTRNKEEWDRFGHGPWDWTNKDVLTEWWRYGVERAEGMETLFTVGMRGDGDLPLTGGNASLVESITATQQGILKDVLKPDASSSIPQMWCMYKEVAGYFQQGLKVPDDVTIMFADDNWGNILTVLPPDSNHTAGAGLYYHADYVGFPRDYKWINTVSLAKTWEQLNIAVSFNTTQVWILNIGDLKMLELPIEHYMALAYDSSRWPRNSVQEFLRLWATREFGKDTSEEVANIMEKYSMYASRIKAELLNSTLWSFSNYDEAQMVLEQWGDLVTRAQKTYHELPGQTQPAFYELVLVPILLQENLNRLQISVGLSNIHAFQGLTSANLHAQAAMDAFDKDFEITETFHSLLDRKWDHMLDQTHIYYQNFLEPVRDSLPPVPWINPNQPTRTARSGTIPGADAYVRYTVENSLGAWPGESKYNCEKGYACPQPTLLPIDPYGSQTRWVGVGSGGPRDTNFTVYPQKSWLKVDPDHGAIKQDGSTDMKVYISVDWKEYAESDDFIQGETTGIVQLASSDGSNVTVTVPVYYPSNPAEEYRGFVQGDGYVVMEAAHFSKNTSVEGYAYQEIDGYGRTLSGISMFPVTAYNFTLGTGPSLTYTFWSHSSRSPSPKTNGTPVEITIQIGPSNNFILNRQLTFGLQIDSETPQTIFPIPLKSLADVATPGDDNRAKEIGAVPSDWINVVSSEIRNVTVSAHLAGDGGGVHELTLWGMSAGLIFERIWIDFGGIKQRGWSYLGPPESRRFPLA